MDVNGNIALATEPYSQVQDTASACRMHVGDAYLDTTIGIPYFTQILGHFQPVQILRERLAQQTLAAVPGVTSATAVISSLVDRSLSGQVQITTADGDQVVTL